MPLPTYTIVAAGNVLLEHRTQSHLAIVDGLVLALCLQQQQQQQRNCGRQLEALGLHVGQRLLGSRCLPPVFIVPRQRRQLFSFFYCRAKTAVSFHLTTACAA